MCRDFKDPASFSNFQEVQITHIDLDWEINFDTNVINGAAFLHLNVSKSTDKVILDTRDLNVNKIYLNNEPVQFSFNKGTVLGDELRIQVPTLTPGKR